jgi:predicted Zn-dependent protease
MVYGNKSSLDTSELQADSSETINVQTGLMPEEKDTINIVLPPLYLDEGDGNRLRGMNAELDSAVYDFNNGKFDEACKKFNLLQETLKENDSLYYETIFYNAECFIAHNEYKLANRTLNKLMDKKLSPNLKQRVLLRQGHLLCALGDENAAQWYFDKLKSEFPNSIYFKLATCSSLK